MTARAGEGYGAVTLTALVVANMVGAGVFTTSGFALADLGSPSRVLAAWGVGGIVAVCGAIGYGSLARHLTASGGEYLFLSRVLHPAVGFVAGWVSLLAGFTGAIAFAAQAFESYVRPATGPWPEGSLAVGAVVFAAIAHGLRARPGALSQNAVVAVKLTGIVAFLALAFAAGRPAGSAAVPLPPPEFSVVDFARSLVWISLSYSGFNAAVYVAGEARDARRNVPRALLTGTLVVGALYLALNFVFVALAPADVVRGRPDVAAAAAGAVLGDSGAALVRVIVALALLSSVLSMTMAGPRVFAQMAEDGFLPSRLRRRGEVPGAAIALQALLAVIVILASDLEGLLSYLGLTLSLSAALTVSCVFVVRRRHGAAAAPVTGTPLLPAAFVVATLLFAVLSAQRQPVEVLGAIATIVSGGLAYVVARRGRAGSI